MNRYFHRRVSPDEFRQMLKRASMKIGDFLLVTGRRRQQVDQFLDGRGDFMPTMGDALVLELAADAVIRNRMFEIAASYIDEDRQKHERSEKA